MLVFILQYLPKTNSISRTTDWTISWNCLSAPRSFFGCTGKESGSDPDSGALLKAAGHLQFASWCEFLRSYCTSFSRWDKLKMWHPCWRRWYSFNSATESLDLCKFRTRTGWSRQSATTEQDRTPVEWNYCVSRLNPVWKTEGIESITSYVIFGCKCEFFDHSFAT